MLTDWFDRCKEGKEANTASKCSTCRGMVWGGVRVGGEMWRVGEGRDGWGGYLLSRPRGEEGRRGRTTICALCGTVYPVLTRKIVNHDT